MAKASAFTSSHTTLLHADSHRKLPSTLWESRRSSLPHLRHADVFFQLASTGYPVLPHLLQSCPQICSGALPCLWGSQRFPSFPICCLHYKWQRAPGCCNATGPTIICCNEEKHELLEEGEKSWKQEVTSKVTKANAVYLERRSTHCCLSLQVRAGNGLQCLIRWGN